MPPIRGCLSVIRTTCARRAGRVRCEDAVAHVSRWRGPTIRRGVTAAPRILVPMVQVRILAAEQPRTHTSARGRSPLARHTVPVLHSPAMMHIDEARVDATTRRLVDDSFPTLRHLPVRPATSRSRTAAVSWPCSGNRAARPSPTRCMACTVPRPGAEATAARELAACSPVPTPEPVGIGNPGHGYPLPWSVQTWVPGRTADADGPGRSAAFAVDLAGLLHRLRDADTPGRRFAGARPRRGVAPARRRAAGAAARGAGLRPRGVGAGTGLGVRAGDGPGLVLPDLRPGAEQVGPAHAGPTAA